MTSSLFLHNVNSALHWLLSQTHEAQKAPVAILHCYTVLIECGHGYVICLVPIRCMRILTVYVVYLKFAWLLYRFLGWEGLGYEAKGWMYGHLFRVIPHMEWSHCCYEWWGPCDNCVDIVVFSVSRMCSYYVTSLFLCVGMCFFWPAWTSWRPNLSHMRSIQCGTCNNFIGVGLGTRLNVGGKL